MKTAEAFAPAHITGLFQICDESADPLYKGSKGAGVLMKHGVKTKVTLKNAPENNLEIWINGRKTVSANVSETVAKDFLSKLKEKIAVTVEHAVHVPIGAGFGSSGAAALSLALTLNRALNLGLTSIEAAQTAHTAEILCKTGLGTVIAETCGGLEIRTEPGASGIGKVQHIPISDDYKVVCLSFGSLSTRKALTDTKLRQRINEWGGKLLESLMEEPNLKNFLRFSKRFAEHTGLITERVRRVLNETDASGIVCSMPMFGEGAFSIAKKDDLETLLEIFRRHGSADKILVSEIDFGGARLL
ncbi:MAG: pantoate kinase [Candidatus Bathyarchaeota archaeon]|nr:pantoate kinase [Candidatus Bathyarchaeota archaeon]